MRIFVVALLLVLTYLSAWPGSNSTASSRSVPHWRSGANSRAPAPSARNAQPARNGPRGQNAQGAVNRPPPPRRAFSPSRQRPRTGTMARICRGCR